MGLGGQIEDTRDLVLLEKLKDQPEIVDITLHEAIAGIAIGADEIGLFSGVGQLIEDDQALDIFAPEEVASQSGTDEAGTAGE